ncbi:MAG: DUF3892 domain-containing protein [Abitibacteriaceae bacterium]|nr:DUF3892 domain-containing protein [Abditibacteriaceae bacterium]MBV9868317.1 DUF3892 domain-containing protein [Abditibacteriaceae bacterium]
MATEIKCINKSDRANPHERITHIGGMENGSRWRMTQSEGITVTETAKARGQVAFVVRRGGYCVNVIVATHNGNKYLKTEPDGVQPDNLLALPECPRY